MFTRFRNNVAVGLLTVAGLSHSAWAAPELVGRISSLIGNVQIKGDNAVRTASVASPIYKGESVVTGNGEAANVLLESRAVVKMDSNTEIAVDVGNGPTTQPDDAAKLGKMNLQLQQGTVVIYLAKRRPGDRVLALHDTIATIDATGTVYSATYTPQTQEGIYTCEESSIKVSLKNGGTTTVPANELARVRNGQLVGGLEKLDLQAFRARTPALQQLGQQAAKRDGTVAQRRADAVTVRQALAKEVQRQGTKAPQKSVQLADLLLARCEDLDVLADTANKAGNQLLSIIGNRLISNALSDPSISRNDRNALKALEAAGIDGVVTTANGNVKLFVLDPDKSGSRISIQARSCTDSNIKSLSTILDSTPELYTLTVGSPNILEVTMTDQNAKGVQNQLSVRLGPPDKPATDPSNLRVRPFISAHPSKVVTLHILVRGG